MIYLHRLITRLFPDRRPDWEQKREREFIKAANGLKTLRVTPEGGMSIDPEELREQIVASREQLKHLVHKPGAPSGLFKAEGYVHCRKRWAIMQIAKKNSTCFYDCFPRRSTRWIIDSWAEPI